MVSANQTPQLQDQRKPSTPKPQIEREDYGLFWEVVQKYQCLGFSEPLVSSNPNPTGRRKKRTATVADFVIDVESATQFTLQGTGLFAQWHRLAKDSVRPESGVMRQIIRLCAPVYRERGLQPDRYFTPVGRTGGRHSAHTSPKSGVRRCSGYRYRESKSNLSFLCRQHGLQAVTDCTKGSDGKIMRLQCGCERRGDIASGIAPRGSVVSISAMPALLSAEGITPIPELIGTAA